MPYKNKKKYHMYFLIKSQFMLEFFAYKETPYIFILYEKTDKYS